MGAGGKFEASKVKVTDISKSTTCPLAKVVRKRLKKKVFTVALKWCFRPKFPMKPVSK